MKVKYKIGDYVTTKNTFYSNNYGLNPPGEIIGFSWSKSKNKVSNKNFEESLVYQISIEGSNLKDVFWLKESEVKKITKEEFEKIQETFIQKNRERIKSYLEQHRLYICLQLENVERQLRELE